MSELRDLAYTLLNGNRSPEPEEIQRILDALDQLERLPPQSTPPPFTSTHGPRCPRCGAGSSWSSVSEPRALAVPSGHEIKRRAAGEPVVYTHCPTGPLELIEQYSDRPTMPDPSRYEQVGSLSWWGIDTDVYGCALCGGLVVSAETHDRVCPGRVLPIAH